MSCQHSLIPLVLVTTYILLISDIVARIVYIVVFLIVGLPYILSHRHAKVFLLPSLDFVTYT